MAPAVFSPRAEKRAKITAVVGVSAEAGVVISLFMLSKVLMMLGTLMGTGLGFGRVGSFVGEFLPEFVIF